VDLANSVAAGARRWIARGWGLTLWVVGHMALPMGWGKHLRGLTLRALGHAKRPGHPAPPFSAAQAHCRQVPKPTGRTAALIRLKKYIFLAKVLRVEERSEKRTAFSLGGDNLARGVLYLFY
jgi:hypothetical protein